MEISILITTFNRRNILHDCLDALQGCLYLTEDQTYWVVADDGSDDGTEEMLAECYPDVHYFRQERKGLGACENLGLREAFNQSDVVLQLQDDMILNCSLDLGPAIKKLREDPQAGWVKIGAYNDHQYLGSLHGAYWVVSWYSPTQYIVSDKPHLKHKRFHDLYGYYPENLKIADTENFWVAYCRDKAQRHETRGEIYPLDVLIPTWIPENCWNHVGKSWQEVGL